MSYRSSVINLGASSYWKLDEASAAGGPVDQIGGVTGTYDGTGITYSEPGLAPDDTGTSVKLDDTVGGAVNLTDVYDFAGTVPFAAVAWGKLETFSVVNGHFIVCKRIVAGGHGWSLYLAPPAVTIVALRLIGGVFESATHLVSEASVEGSTHMFGMTYDGSRIWVIYDGEHVASVASTGSITGHAVALTIGKFSDGGGSTWDGWIDETAVWSRHLTPRETRDLYVGYSPGSVRSSALDYDYAR